MATKHNMKTTGFAKIVLLAALAAVYVLPIGDIARARPETRPLLMAHRGGNKETDENTLASYANAIKLGMDYIECDPRLTKDGVFVIMHDPDVGRTTDGKGKVADLTLEEINRLRTKHGERVPLFEDVLNLAKKAGASVFVDTKLYTADYMERLVALIEKTGMGERVMLGLWSVEQLRWVHKNHPDLATNIPYPAPVSSMKTAKKLGAVWIGTLLDRATPDMISAAETAGLKVVTMPINDRDTIMQKIDEGMQVIQTDDPKLLRAIIDELWPPK